ncbi:MAG: glutathione S-transferase family protein [Steroidobacteraceae bacterium]
MNQHRYVLWGTAHSLYTGKVRSYLRKKGLPFVERYPSDPEFGSRIVPAIRHVVVPVVEAPDGAILQDTTEIIERLEVAHPGPAMLPPGPVQAVAAGLIDAFGCEALLPAAMHYRWSYRTEQETFLAAEFGRSVYAGPDRNQQRRAGAEVMAYFNSFLPALGITPGTIPTFEAAYLEFLDALDVHLQQWPYLLGGRPSIADFGLMAPLYAHLGRDPVPASLMKNRAPNVFRWTERMNTPGLADPEFARVPTEWLPDDAIPPSLEPLLEILFRDWTPELEANAACYAAWLATDPARPTGTPVTVGEERKIHPTLGPIEHAWRGVTVRRASAPHGLWHFERAAARARELQGADRSRLTELLDRVGGRKAMALELRRPMRRDDFLLVLG